MFINKVLKIFATGDKIAKSFRKPIILLQINHNS